MIRTTRPRCWVPLAASLCALIAGPPAACAGEGGGTYTLQLENDRSADTDRHYTHGTRLSWVSDRQTGGPEWARDLLETLYPLAEVRAGRIGFALGQNIYTPEDTESKGLVADDRPYAGWLYGAVSLHAETKRRMSGIEIDVLDSVELNLGVVGPYSLAEDTQNTVHETIGVSRSHGWHNQLDNEPAFSLFFERKWRPDAWRFADIEADAIPHVGGSIGNVFTLGNVGTTVRLGQDLALDYGPPHIRPTLSGLEAVDAHGRLGWYIFAGAEGSAVLRNIFLDGNTFSDSHHVDKNTFVGDIQVGVAVVIDDVRVAFTHVFRTREFGDQRRGDRYGTLSLSAHF